MPNFGTIEVTSSTVAVSIVPADGVQVCIVNSDSANTLFLGDNNAIHFGDQNVTPLGAGNSVTFDGSKEIFAISPPGTSIVVLSYPTASNAQQSPQAPAIIPPMISSQSIGSGNTVDLIGNAQNPNGYAVQLSSLYMSSASDGDSNHFVLEDTITDSSGKQYFALEVKSNDVTTGSIDLKGAVMPAGRKLRLNNGGDAGGAAFRRCTATVVYYLQN